MEGKRCPLLLAAWTARRGTCDPTDDYDKYRRDEPGQYVQCHPGCAWRDKSGKKCVAHSLGNLDHLARLPYADY